MNIFYFKPRVINNEHADWYQYCALVFNAVFCSIDGFLLIIDICLINQITGCCTNGYTIIWN